MTTRVLFLMSDTGGGHRAAANALAEALAVLHGEEVTSELVDLLASYSHWPLTQAPQLYQPLVAHHAWLWRLLWWSSDQAGLLRMLIPVFSATHRQHLERCFTEHPADLVVSVHPLLNHVPRGVLRSLRPDIPFATVVTDLSTAARLWYDPGVDRLCVPCQEVYDAALACGVPPDRMRLLGLPIGLRFLEDQPDQPTLRRLLGLQDLPTVLVVGGGAGMGALDKIATALAAALAGMQAQLVVICGRNEGLRAELAQRSWVVPTQILGFVGNMPQWMAAADCIVTKAGPGTIAEALACGLPILLSGFVPGQETGNVGYVVDSGVGAYSSDPTRIGEIVAGWLAPGNEDLVTMRARAHALARPAAALEIATALSELLAGGA